MKYYCILLLVLLSACSSNKLKIKSPIDSSGKDFLISSSNIKNWHLKDLEQDTLPGISWTRTVNEFPLNFSTKNSCVIAVLDNPLDIQNNIIQKYVWKNKKEKPDGLDNDFNGYSDDVNGWNFLGDTLNSTVQFNQFEYTRIISKNIDRGINKKKQVEEDSIFSTALIKYNSMLTFSKKIIENAPAFLTTIRNQLSNPLLPKDENEITIKLLDSLVANGYVVEKEVNLLRRLRKNNSTLKDLLADSLNYARHLKYYLNPKYNDRVMIKGYTGQPNNFYHGNNIVNSNTDKLNHSNRTSGVIALALEKIRNDDKNIKLMPIVISNYGDEHDLDIIAGIKYAVDNGARVINMSSGKSFSMYSKEVLDMLKYAEEKDVLFVTSAGNENLDLEIERNYPNDTDFLTQEERVSNFLKVGGSNFILNNKLKYTQSNYGLKQVDIFAPGENITTLFSNEVSGTSYAAPQVSLIAALLFSQYPSLTAPEVKKILMDSSVKYDVLVDVPTKENPEQQLPFSALSKSGGIVNAYNAMLMAEEYVKSKK